MNCTNCHNGDMGYELTHDKVSCIADNHSVKLEDGIGLSDLIVDCPFSYGVCEDV